jgi:hypothetical protein
MNKIIKEIYEIADNICEKYCNYPIPYLAKFMNDNTDLIRMVDKNTFGVTEK